MVEPARKSFIGAYGLSVQVEGSVQQLEYLAGRLQQVFLAHPKTVDVEGAGTLLIEMSRLLERTQVQIRKLEGEVGRPAAAPTARPRPVVKIPANGLRGSTRSIPIPDLVGLLSSQSKTGTLYLKAEAERFVLEFLKGAVVHAVTNTPHPDQRLGTILVAQNSVSAEDLDAFLEQHDSKAVPLGAALARANLVSEENLLGALNEQVQVLFRRIFEVEDCLFYFAEGEVRGMEHRVCLNTIQLLLESARSQDERARV